MAKPVAKQPKAAVGYKRGGDHCGACRYFIAPADGDDQAGQCERVEGAIGEDMWCRLFSRRTATVAQGSYGG